MTVTVGAALIAKNEAAHLTRLLPQLLPCFDQVVVVVDTDSSDNTAQIARDLGADVYDDWVWIDDFSAKREYSFSKLKTEWAFWADADDIIEGVEKARDIVNAVAANPSHPTSIWCNYAYDRHAESGKLVAQHKRERFIKLGSGWYWEGRVHEHLIIKPPVPPMAETNDIVVLHDRDRSLDTKRNERNIRILRKQLKDKPGDARTYYDLGSQMYHGTRPARAIGFYRRFLKAIGDQKARPFECYQALHRMADCFRMLGRPDRAEEFDWQAFQLIPEWKDAPFGLGESAYMQHQWKRALMWTQDGFNELREKPTNLLVLNDLDYDFHPRLAAHGAYAAMGAVDEALNTVNEALAIVPQHQELLKAKAGYEAFQVDEKRGRDAIALSTDLDPDVRLGIYSSLSPMVRRRPAVRDALAAPALLKNKGADLIIWCGPSIEEFGPSTPEERGIGGSETAVIEIAKRLGEAGVNVAVYNQCQEHEGKYGNVRYIDFQRYDLETRCKLFCGWRNPTIFQNAIAADKRWLWVHDLNWGPGVTPEMVTTVDMVRPVSQWHADHLRWLYPFLGDRLAPTRNGITLSRFTRSGDTPARVSHLAVYGSSPDRGLIHLLAMWPHIRREVDDAELRVAYGFAIFDKSIAQVGPEQQQRMLQMKQQIEQAMQQPGVTNLGRIPQSELHKVQQQAAILAYPTDFLEVSHIGGMECMAAGAVVFSTITGAIPETTAGAAFLLRGHPQSEAYRATYVKNVVAAMEKPELLEPIREKGYQRAAQLDWQPVADEWLTHLTGDAPTDARELVAVN